MTGLLELAGALMVLVPRTRVWGAGLLACVMLGAIAAHLAILRTSPAGPIALLVFAGVVAWGRRSDVTRLQLGDVDTRATGTAAACLDLE